MHLWPVEHLFPHFLTAFAQQKQSKSEEKSVQLARGAFVINDFLRNPHFSNQPILSSTQFDPAVHYQFFTTIHV